MAVKSIVEAMKMEARIQLLDRLDDVSQRKVLSREQNVCLSLSLSLSLSRSLALSLSRSLALSLSRSLALFLSLSHSSLDGRKHACQNRTRVCRNARFKNTSMS